MPSVACVAELPGGDEAATENVGAARVAAGAETARREVARASGSPS